MGSFNANILPAQAGLNLGNTNQLWTAYVQDVFANTVHSNTSGSALTGTLRLASSDTISWRNAAGNGDVALSKTGANVGTLPADTLAFGGGGIQGVFISSNSNPASTGMLRLNGADTIYFRNNANTGDVLLAQHNSDDTITLGGTAGVKVQGPFALTGNETITGNLTVTGSVTSVGTYFGTGNTSLSPVIPNSGTGATCTLQGGTGQGANNGGDAFVQAGSGGAGGNTNGGNTHIVGGAKNASGANGSVLIGDTQTTAIQLVAPITNVNGTVAGQGVSAVRGVTSQKAETALDNSVLSLTPPATAGSYRLRAVISVSAAASAVLGWTATWKDSNGAAQSPTNLSLFAQGTAAPALTFTTSAAGNYSGETNIDIDNSATAIMIKFTLASGTVTAKVTATIEQIV